MTRILTLLALFALTPVVSADDARDRNARAALALAGATRPVIATAPAPRVAITKDYAAGCEAAKSKDLPLVVFVGCPGRPVEGAVVAKAEEFGDTKAPAVVVGFPAGDRLFIHATLGCPATDADLGTAVKAASKKVGEPMPKDRAAPKPLSWDVRADVGGCRCGEVCPCCAAKPEAKPAPAKSAVRPDADLHISPDGTVNARGADGIYRAIPGAAKQAPPTLPSHAPASLPAYPFPAASPCAGGRCPAPTQYAFPAAGGCASGQCPTPRR